MHGYRLLPGRGSELERFELKRREPQGREVGLRIRAAAFNYRDLMVVRGQYRGPIDHPLIPLADAAGEVVALGPEASRFKLGDRVTITYFPNWVDGAMTPAKIAASLGTPGIDGVLAEEIVLREDALVAIPAHLDFVEAATLSCAGVTAWNALFVGGGVKPGDTVLLLGTGGVSIWALQLAKAAGLRAIITSSDDRKLERARSLGADHTINYPTVPEWQDEVLRATDNSGVDLVVEVGGEGTLARSVAATRTGGSIAVIGGLSGFGRVGDLDIFSVLRGAKRIFGVDVGSCAMFEDFARFVGVARLRPVVDRAFGFAEASAVYAELEAGRHFGKLVIKIGD